LKKSAKDGGSFNLGFEDQGDKYQYNGTRTSEDGNYVLIFDPARKAFVLHRVDSMFHMNITKTPTDGVESLRKKFPQLEVNNAGSTSSTGKQQQKVKDTPATADKAKPPASGKGKGKEPKAAPRETTAKGKKAKPEKPAPKPMELTLPTAAPPRKAPSPPPPPAAEETKPKRRARSPVESEEEEDDDDDGGLILEFPDGDPPSSFKPSFPPSNAFSPAFGTTRRFSEFVRSGGQEEEEDEDADADAEGEDEMIEDEEEEMEDVKLPSPINRPVIATPEEFQFETGDLDADVDEFDEADVGDLGDLGDLEAEFEKELMRVGNEVPGHDSDSSMSEEE